MRFRLRGALELFFASDGDAYLLRGGSGAEHVIRRPDDDDRLLLQRLAAPAGAEAPHGGPVRKRLEPLINAGAVVPDPGVSRLGSTDAERFARQLPYLEDYGDPVAAQQRLRAARVAILGCGGLGTWALAALAGAGVGGFVLVDDDIVSLSNLNRQMLYRTADLGDRKVDRAAAWVQAFDPAIDVVTHPTRLRSEHGVAAAADGCDVIVLTADWPPYDIARWVNRASLAGGIPWIMAGQQPPLVKVGPTFLPGTGSACFECLEAHARAAFPLYDELAAQRRRSPPDSATLGAASALVGALLALEVMHLLLDAELPATDGRMMVVDIRTLRTRLEELEPHPACPRC
jgi:molybdopterin/thiamine biosynthesis adenylyltransferase